MEKRSALLFPPSIKGPEEEIARPTKPKDVVGRLRLGKVVIECPFCGERHRYRPADAYAGAGLRAHCGGVGGLRVTSVVRGTAAWTPPPSAAPAAKPAPAPKPKPVSTRKAWHGDICPNGHLTTEADRFTPTRGQRGCRICKSESAKRKRAAQRATAIDAAAATVRAAKAPTRAAKPPKPPKVKTVKVVRVDKRATPPRKRWEGNICPNGHATTEADRSRSRTGGWRCRICLREQNTRSRRARGVQPKKAWQGDTCPNGHRPAPERISLGSKGNRVCNICRNESNARRAEANGTRRKRWDGDICPNGHVTTPETRRVTPRGVRCEACEREWRAKNADRLREQRRAYKQRQRAKRRAAQAEYHGQP